MGDAVRRRLYGTPPSGLLAEIEYQLVERTTLSTTTAMEMYSFYSANTNTSTLNAQVVITQDTTTNLGTFSRAVRV